MSISKKIVSFPDLEGGDGTRPGQAARHPHGGAAAPRRRFEDRPRRPLLHGGLRAITSAFRQTQFRSVIKKPSKQKRTSALPNCSQSKLFSRCTTCLDSYHQVSQVSAGSARFSRIASQRAGCNGGDLMGVAPSISRPLGLPRSAKTARRRRLRHRRTAMSSCARCWRLWTTIPGVRRSPQDRPPTPDPNPCPSLHPHTPLIPNLNPYPDPDPHMRSHVCSASLCCMMHGWLIITKPATVPYAGFAMNSCCSRSPFCRRRLHRSPSGFIQANAYFTRNHSH